MGNVVLQHTLNRLHATVPIPRPFPHAVVEDVFPGCFYAAAVSRLPPAEAYQWRRSTAVQSHAGTRADLWLTPGAPELPDGVRGFWTRFRRLVAGPQIPRAILSLFQPHLDSDTISRLRGNGMRTGVRFVRESGPNILPPHLDMPHKTFTFILYFPEDDRLRDLGTTLYRRRLDGGFTPSHTIRYSPNTALIMLRTPQSWHGGDFSTARPTAVRHTIHLYLSPSELPMPNPTSRPTGHQVYDTPAVLRVLGVLHHCDAAGDGLTFVPYLLTDRGLAPEKAVTLTASAIGLVRPTGWSVRGQSGPIPILSVTFSSNLDAGLGETLRRLVLEDAVAHALAHLERNGQRCDARCVTPELDSLFGGRTCRGGRRGGSCRLPRRPQR